MMLEMAIGILLVCIIGSAFASGSETALVSASRIRLQHLDTEGHRGAKTALGLLRQRDQILAVTLIATNAFNITGGAVATATLERLLGPSAGPIVATAGMTCILLIFSEIVPKAYFRHHADRMLVGTGGLWRFLSWVVTPITYPLQFVTNLFFKIIQRAPRSPFTSREEIKLVLEESAEEGGLLQHEQEMLEGALEYGETVAREVMVPIPEVALLPEVSTTEDFLALARERGFTRVPIFRERVDQIVGLVNVFDVLYDPERKTFIRSYVRPARLVPDTKRIDELFLEMQRERESLAAVVNEFGACIGIVSTEDIIEEIFGELSDEHEDATPEMKKIGPGHYEVSARTDIDDLNDETGWTLPQVGYQTVAGYVLYRLGHIPIRGEEFEDDDLLVRVLDADRFGVKLVELMDRSEKPDRKPNGGGK